MTHGHRGHSNDQRTGTYNSWRAMRERCTYPRHPKWPNYGGRGVLVCDRWARFELFLADMGERPAGTTLDRVDSNDHYYPANCRWATPLQQVWNRRTIGDVCDWDEPVRTPPAGLFTVAQVERVPLPF